MKTRYVMTVTTDCCGYHGTLANVELHNCDVERNSGRCEDYPCCGHTDGDGCQTLASHTGAFYLDNPQLMHEPGSPAWHDAMEYRWISYQEAQDDAAAERDYEEEEYNRHLMHED